jgi:hypothetical protein
MAHEAVIAWLTNLLFGGFFKHRYAAEIRRAVETDGSAFRQVLIDIAGARLGLRLWQAAVSGHPEVSSAWTFSLRLVVWWRAFFRAPVRTIQRFCAYVIAELRLRFAPSVPWIAIVGADAAVRSAVVHEVVQRFAGCFYTQVKASLWDAQAIPAPAAAGPQSQRRRPNGRIRACIAVALLAVRWLVDYWTRLVHLRAKGYVVAFDGTFVDRLVDHRGDLPPAAAWLGRVLWRLLPKPDLLFVVDPAQPSCVLVDDVERAVRAWTLKRSAASLHHVEGPPLTMPARQCSSDVPPLNR